jgi:hypothetical protein
MIDRGQCLLKISEMSWLFFFPSLFSLLEPFRSVEMGSTFFVLLTRNNGF